MTPRALAVAPPLGDIVLAVTDLRLSFGTVQAVDGISLDVREREIHAVIGPNGAGKTSLINGLSGVCPLHSGHIAFAGRVFGFEHGSQRLTAQRMARLGAARTFQHLALFNGMSVLDNIMAGRNLHMKCGVLLQALHWGPALREEIAQRREAERVIDCLGLHAHRRTAVGRLPYGLQKRVDFGRALAMRPRLLLLDEPTAGMSVKEKRDMCRVILEVTDDLGLAVVLIEHDMDVVMDLSHRVAVLDRGRKIADGPPEAVRSNARVGQARLSAAAPVRPQWAS